MRDDQERVKILLTEAVKLLCRNSLQFEEEVSVEGLIGITLDKKDVFLVSINEFIQGNSPKRKEILDDEERANKHSSSISKRRKIHEENIEKIESKKVIDCNLPIINNDIFHPKDNGASSDNIDEAEIFSQPLDIKTEQLDYTLPEEVNCSQDSIYETPSHRLDGNSVSSQKLDEHSNSFSQDINLGQFDSHDRTSFDLTSDIKIKEEITDDNFGCYLIDNDEDDQLNSSNLDSFRSDCSFSDNKNWTVMPENVLATGQYMCPSDMELPGCSNTDPISITPSNSRFNSPDMNHKESKKILEGSHSFYPHHPLVKIPSTKKNNPTRRCRVCYSNNKRRESRFCCLGCHSFPGLCFGACYEKWHKAVFSEKESMDNYLKNFSHLFE